MRTRLLTFVFGIVALLGLGASPLRAGDSPLAPYEWLIGEWIGGGEYPGVGKYTVSYLYEWTMDRRFMKTTYVMVAGDRVVWTDLGMVGWDSARGCMVGFNFGMEGSIGWGRTIEEESPESFRMEGRVVGTDSPKDFRVRMRRKEPDVLEVVMEQKQGESWTALPPQVYRRKSAETPGVEAPGPAPAPQTPPAAALRSLAPFEGAWRSEREETAFEWVFHGQFLRRRETRKDPEGRGRESLEWIGWDPEKQALAVFVFGADGAIRVGKATCEDGALALERGSDWLAGAPEGRTVYRIDEKGRLHLREEGEPGGAPVREAILERE